MDEGTHFEIGFEMNGLERKLEWHLFWKRWYSIALGDLGMFEDL